MLDDSENVRKQSLFHVSLVSAGGHDTGNSKAAAQTPCSTRPPEPAGPGRAGASQPVPEGTHSCAVTVPAGHSSHSCPLLLPKRHTPPYTTGVPTPTCWLFFTLLCPLAMSREGHRPWKLHLKNYLMLLFGSFVMGHAYNYNQSHNTSTK